MKSLPLLLTVALAVAAHAGEAWTTDFKAAQAAAKKDGKPILIDFTGSDWCGWCIKMKKESLDKTAFKDFAQKELVLVEADFPNSKPQTAEVKAQNEALKKKYKVNGFPTFVLINADGKELGRQEGYLEGGPDAFTSAIKGWAAKK
jgi:protein disulfide-isomerase